MSTNTNPDEFLDVRKSAEFLTLAKSTLDKQRVRGDGPKFHKFGRRVVYSRASLVEWAAQRMKTSTSDQP